MAEVTLKSILNVSTGAAATGATQIVYVKGTSAVNNDTLTIPGIVTIQGAYLISTTGTAATMTFATNVITITNGSTLVWSGLAWGVS